MAPPSVAPGRAPNLTHRHRSCRPPHWIAPPLTCCSRCWRGPACAARASAGRAAALTPGPAPL